ncbi:hypothetical protein VQH23_26140 (plasmid) [Pararoseomonas sp. SCSIO 73927]|uniref:hypothetical protein n=1 Tax=Pararoseomonas sp. SCSIO 73927 TaxID=3114537 RepID=UPI0030D34825
MSQVYKDFSLQGVARSLAVNPARAGLRSDAVVRHSQNIVRQIKEAQEMIDFVKRHGQDRQLQRMMRVGEPWGRPGY